MVVICGQVVVICVANVVCWLHVFRGLKLRHSFQLYFAVSQPQMATKLGRVRVD